MINPIEELRKEGKYITSPFGYRNGGASGNTTYKAGMHRGTDMGGWKCGEPFYAPLAGTITAVKTSGMGTWGNTLCLSPDGDPNHTMLVAHLQSISVKLGKRVKKGQEIAKIGGTTHTGATYACHPHIEIQKHDNNWTPATPWRGTPINPEYYWVDQAPAKPSTRFAAGNIVFSTAKGNVNIRPTPGTTGNPAGQIAAGEKVQIKADPGNGTRAGGYAWWKIDRGWIAEDFFELLTFPDPAPVTPPEQAEKEFAELLTLMLKKWPGLALVFSWIENQLREEADGQ
jgi:hypothetical protein